MQGKYRGRVGRGGAGGEERYDIRTGAGDMMQGYEQGIGRKERKRG